MKLVDAFDIHNVVTGLIFVFRTVQIGPSRYGPGWAEYSHEWRDERYQMQLLAEFGACRLPHEDFWTIRVPSIMTWDWSEEHQRRRWVATAESTMLEFRVRLVRTECCGCCGANSYGRGMPWRKIQVVAEGVYRCKKHVGRSPCCIDGCGKTWALKGDETYEWRFICGRHWREAPKWMRDRVAKLRKLAKRRGWTEKLVRVHSMAWDRCIDTILARRAVPAVEILPSSGPPPATMLRELEQLGL